MVVELLAGVPATDVDRAVAWYERLLGRAPDEDATWQLAEGGGIAIVRDPERAGTAAITFVVENLDESLAALAERGITSGRIVKVRRVMRKSVVTDPDGNRLTFAESLS